MKRLGPKLASADCADGLLCDSEARRDVRKRLACRAVRNGHGSGGGGVELGRTVALATGSRRGLGLLKVFHGRFQGFLCSRLAKGVGGCCRPVRLASSPAALGAHVRHVFGLGSKKKVCGVDAQPVVASMADGEAVWDWPVGKLPGEAMRVCGRGLAATESDCAVSVRLDVAGPSPASFRLSDSRPEPLGQRRTFVVGHAQPAITQE